MRPADRRPLVVAHRGASGRAPDNSLDAFAKAIDVGADMIELDLRRTRTGELVAFHDARARGAPVGRLTAGEIGERTGRAPPLLEEVLELARGRIVLDVELKEDGYVGQVLSVLDGSDVVVSSFLDAVVAQVKRLRPDLDAGLVIGLCDRFAVRRAQAADADHLALHWRRAGPGVLAAAAEAGLPAMIWTVNDDDRLRRYLGDPRVHGVITDRPERALELRAAAGARAPQPRA
jgi:glycerophosphoryl diester phosphodiesterase